MLQSFSRLHLAPVDVGIFRHDFIDDPVDELAGATGGGIEIRDPEALGDHLIIVFAGRGTQWPFFFILSFPVWHTAGPSWSSAAPAPPAETGWGRGRRCRPVIRPAAPGSGGWCAVPAAAGVRNRTLLAGGVKKREQCPDRSAHSTFSWKDCKVLLPLLRGHGVQILLRAGKPVVDGLIFPVDHLTDVLWVRSSMEAPWISWSSSVSQSCRANSCRSFFLPYSPGTVAA